MKPEEAKVIAEFLIRTFEYELTATHAVIAAVPAEGCHYRPDGLSKTALGLARHIALEDEWMLAAVADGKFGPGKDESDACGLMTPADAADHHQNAVKKELARIRALSGDDLLRTVDMFGMQMPALQFLSLALRHSVHHRGQLSAYLRSAGSKVPAIYGPSADTPMAGVSA
jgi:uncharacterized damage-inducible protein DinB